VRACPVDLATKIICRASSSKILVVDRNGLSRHREITDGSCGNAAVAAVMLLVVLLLPSFFTYTMETLTPG
jgi:hypothetical protein